MFRTDVSTVLDLGKEVKKNCVQNDMLAWQYNTIGVSDGITMGGEGMTATSLYPSQLLHEIYAVVELLY